jgi:hypothetical protein
VPSTTVAAGSSSSSSPSWPYPRVDVPIAKNQTQSLIFLHEVLLLSQFQLHHEVYSNFKSLLNCPVTSECKQLRNNELQQVFNRTNITYQGWMLQIWLPMLTHNFSGLRVVGDLQKDDPAKKTRVKRLSILFRLDYWKLQYTTMGLTFDMIFQP